MNQETQALSIYRAHRATLVQCARSVLKEDLHAEDVVQEAWVRFEEKMQGEDVRSPVSYLYRIVRNLAFDALRKKQQEVPAVSIDAGLEDGFLTPSFAPQPDQELAARDELIAVREAIAELPERTRKALELRRFDQMRFQEIAKRLGVSVTRAHELVAEGVEHCRSKVRPHEEQK